MVPTMPNWRTTQNKDDDKPSLIWLKRCWKIFIEKFQICEKFRLFGGILVFLAIVFGFLCDFLDFSNALSNHCTVAWVTKGVKDVDLEVWPRTPRPLVSEYCQKIPGQIMTLDFPCLLWPGFPLSWCVCMLPWLWNMATVEGLNWEDGGQVFAFLQQHCFAWMATSPQCFLLCQNILGCYNIDQPCVGIFSVTRRSRSDESHLLTERSHWLYWCNPGEWRYLLKTSLVWPWWLWWAWWPWWPMKVIWWWKLPSDESYLLMKVT